MLLNNELNLPLEKEDKEMDYFKESKRIHKVVEEIKYKFDYISNFLKEKNIIDERNDN